MQVVALVGRSGSGKSTAARGILERIPTADQFAFAWRLKEIVGDLYGLTTAQLHGAERHLVDPRWGMTPRRILQRFGTQVGRAVHPETWTRYLFERELADHGHVELAVIDDVRFRNEVAAIKARGGITIRIVRPGLARWPWLRVPWLRRLLLGEHASEASVDSLPVDHEITNDGTPADLQRLVLELLREEYGIGPAREDLLAG